MTQALDPITTIEAAAAQDPDFKAALLADPRAAIEAKSGTALPDDWALEAHLDGDGAVRLGFANDELPTDYLEAVGGGAWWDDAYRGFEKVIDALH